MIVTGMAPSFLAIIVTLLAIHSPVYADLNQAGAKCGQKHCLTTEYCSRFDTQCKPCSTVCDPTDHNHQPEDCTRDCQEYLHDERYALRAELNQYEELKEEVDRLRKVLIATLTLTCLVIIAILFLIAKAFIQWDKIRNRMQRIFAKNWVKKATNNNKVQDDLESGAISKQNGLKVTMPTISANVASTQDTGGSSNGTTPNTTSTPLSRRHPSEDTTLDYAYDNPAMTPSPEAAQLRTKRESSF